MRGERTGTRTAATTAAAAAVIALALTAAACGSTSHKASAPTTLPTTVPTTTTTLPPVSLPTVEAAAAHLIDAWRAGDRRAALQGADPAAVDALFAQPYSPPQGRGCSQGTQPVTCTYRVGDSILELEAVHRPVGWWVDKVTLES